MHERDPTAPFAATASRRHTRQPRGTAQIDVASAAIAALRLADREGLAAVTMRRLASELGIGTTTLYWHFDDKQDLLDAIGAEIGREIVAASLPPAQFAALSVWDRLRLLLRVPVEVLVGHHLDITRLAQQQFSHYGELTRTDPALRSHEQMLATLAEAGVTGRAGARWSYLLLHGVFMLATACRVEDGTTPDERMQAHWRSLVSLSAADFPHSVAAAQDLGRTEREDGTLLNQGIEMYVSAIANAHRE